MLLFLSAQADKDTPVYPVCRIWAYVCLCVQADDRSLAMSVLW